MSGPFEPGSPAQVPTAYHRAAAPLASQHTPRVLISTAYVSDMQAALDAAGVRAELVPIVPEDQAAVIAGLAGADAFVTWGFRSEWLNGGGHTLRLIQLLSTGTDKVDLDNLPPGITVSNLYGHEYAIAEHVFMIMAALNRELMRADAKLRQGDWGDPKPLRELRGRTLVIVGLGHIGRELARWGQFYGMRMTGVTRRPERLSAAELGLQALGDLSDLPTFAQGADFLVTSLPETQETRGLIGANVIGRMRPSAYLVNVGRGPVVDEEALYEALMSGRLAGAGIDVWYRYPDRDWDKAMPANRPFHELDNVILTSHTAGSTEGTWRIRWNVIAENIRCLETGEPFASVVWPAL